MVVKFWGERVIVLRELYSHNADRWVVILWGFVSLICVRVRNL